MKTKKSSFLTGLFFVSLLCFTCITGIVSADSQELLHPLPSMSNDEDPQWEREYVPGNGDPVVEVINEGIVGVINEGMMTASLSLYKAEDAGDFDDFYLKPTDYSVTVSKGENQILVVEAGEYYYHSTTDYYYSSGSGFSESGSGSTSAPIWLDNDCVYRVVFSYRGSSGILVAESTDAATTSTPGFVGLTAIIALIATIVLFEKKRK